MSERSIATKVENYSRIFMSDLVPDEEFMLEAFEILEEAEVHLLELDKGDGAFDEHYNAVFRAMHSLKGAAGMFGIMDLQDHIHTIETQFEKFKNIGSIQQGEIDYFLSAVDESRSLLNGEGGNFNFWDLSDFPTLGLKKEVSHSVQKASTVEKADNLVSLKGEKVKKTDALEQRKKELELKKKRHEGVVFIVDDEPDILILLEDILSEDGYCIYTFECADKLLLKIEEVTPDVILSDINMPGMSGIDMVKNVGQHHSSIPVIFISAYVTKEIMLDMMQYGSFSFIEKPFDPLRVKNATWNAVMKGQLRRLVDKSINYILYQFSDLDEYLVQNNKHLIRDSLKEEFEALLSQRKKLKEMGE